jgi:hypothetical protein
MIATSQSTPSASLGKQSCLDQFEVGRIHQNGADGAAEDRQLHAEQPVVRAEASTEVCTKRDRVDSSSPATSIAG